MAASVPDPPRSMPTMPTRIQNPFSRMYGGSRFCTEHHVSMIASVVLKAHTNKNGLAGPSQLTRLKLKIRISTPVNSIAQVPPRQGTDSLVIRHGLRCRVRDCCGAVEPSYPPPKPCQPRKGFPPADKAAPCCSLGRNDSPRVPLALPVLCLPNPCGLSLECKRIPARLAQTTMRGPTRGASTGKASGTGRRCGGSRKTLVGRCSMRRTRSVCCPTFLRVLRAFVVHLPARESTTKTQRHEALKKTAA